MADLFAVELNKYLRDHGGLSALVDSRVYPGRLPDPPTLPALVYTRVSTVGMSAMDGPMADVEARFQIDVWSDRYLDAIKVAEQVRSALLGFTGTMGDKSVSIPRQTNDQDSYEEETKLYRVMTEFIIWHD